MQKTYTPIIARSTTLASVICLPRLVGLHLRPGQRPAGEADWSAAEERFSDRRLFRSLVSSLSHALSRHLPAIKTTNYNLRLRAHGFTLPEKDTCNFIPWMLFVRIYC